MIKRFSIRWFYYCYFIWLFSRRTTIRLYITRPTRKFVNSLYDWKKKGGYWFLKNKIPMQIVVDGGELLQQKEKYRTKRNHQSSIVDELYNIKCQTHKWLGRTIREKQKPLVGEREKDRAGKFPKRKKNISRLLIKSRKTFIIEINCNTLWLCDREF